MVDVEDRCLDDDAAADDVVVADDDEVGVEGLRDADGRGAGGPEVDGKAEVVESVLAVIFGDSEEAGGVKALVEGVWEGVADPVQGGVAGAVFKRKDEDEAARGVGLRWGLCVGPGKGETRPKNQTEGRTEEGVSAHRLSIVALPLKPMSATIVVRPYRSLQTRWLRRGMAVRDSN